MPSLWCIYTDMDGSLLGVEDFGVGATPVLIRHLATLGIEVVLVTSKTAAEIRHFRLTSGLDLAAIVENGGGYLAASDDESIPMPWSLNASTIEALLPDFWQPQQLSAQSVETQSAVLGLSGEALKRALQREYSVPLLPAVAEMTGLDPRLHAELGGRIANAAPLRQSKAAAIRHQNQSAPKLKSFAIGDGPNDLSMLRQADLNAIVQNPATIDKMTSQITPDFVSNDIAPNGWCQVVEAFLARIGAPLP